MVDDLRVELPRLLVADAQPLGDAGAEVVHDDIRVPQQPVHDLLTLRCLEVDPDALLARRGLEEQHPARRVPADLALGRLDLDHARTEVGEQGAPERRRVEGREVDDQGSVQGRRRRGPGLAGLGRGPAPGVDAVGRPELRRSPAGSGRCLRLPDDRAHLLHSVDLDDVLVVPDLGVIERVARLEEGLDGEVALRVEDRLPLGPGLLAHAVEDGLPDTLAVLGVLECGEVDVARVGVEIGQAEGVHLRHEEMGQGVRELQPDAVLRDRREVVRARDLVLDGAPGAEPIGGERVDRGRLHGVPADHVVGAVALEQARLDVRASMRLAAHVQRGQDALQRRMQRTVARGRHRGERRPAAIGDQARELEHAAGLRRDDALVTLQLRPRTAGAEAADRGVDEAWIELACLLVTEAEARHHAGPEVLDQHVGRGHEFAGGGAAVLGLEIEHAAALAAVPEAPGGMPAERVPRGRLDLDDLGPVVGEDHAGEVAVHAPREVEHAESATGSHHSPSSFPSRAPIVASRALVTGAIALGRGVRLSGGRRLRRPDPSPPPGASTAATSVVARTAGAAPRVLPPLVGEAVHSGHGFALHAPRPTHLAAACTDTDPRHAARAAGQHAVRLTRAVLAGEQ